MKKSIVKSRLIMAGIVLLLVVVIIRILYVNIFYSKTKEENFSIEDYIEYKGLTYKIQGVERYTYDEYRDKYKAAEKNPIMGNTDLETIVCVLNLDVRNDTSEDITANYPGISVNIGASSNAFNLGEANFINKDFSWKCRAGEAKSVKLPYIINCSYLDKRQYNQVLNDKIEVTISDYELLRRIVISEAEQNGGI